MNNFWEVGCEEIYNENGDVVVNTTTNDEEMELFLEA